MSLFEDNSQVECCICFELMEINYNKFFTCKHSEFHTKCVIKCHRCPLCRAPYNLMEDIDTMKIFISFINNLLYIIALNSLMMTILFLTISL